jgi:hypothetical protein
MKPRSLLVAISLLLNLGCDKGGSQNTTEPVRQDLNAHVKAGLPGGCLLNWRLNVTCGVQCTGETQADLANCQAFLDCYQAHDCGPLTCGKADQVCGANVVTPGMGTAPKTVQTRSTRAWGAPPRQDLAARRGLEVRRELEGRRERGARQALGAVPRQPSV